MNKNKRRPKEILVPPIQLGWVRSFGGLKWENVNESSTDIASRHFQNRQFRRGAPPQGVETKLKRARIRECVLRHFAEGQVQRRKKREDEQFRSRVAINIAISTSVNPKSIPNPSLFRREISVLKADVVHFHVPNWMYHAVAVPLGPTHISRLLEERYLPYPLDQYRFDLYTYNNHNTSVMFVEDNRNPHKTRRQVEEVLGLSGSRSEPYLMAAPNGGYAMRLTHGQEPVYVSTAAEITFLVCYDVLKVPRGQTLNKTDQIKALEYMIDVKIRDTRWISEPEKKWIMKRTNRKDLMDARLRLVEFHTVEDKRKALLKLRAVGNEYADEGGEFMFCPTMYNWGEVYEEVLLRIDYDIRPQHKLGVKVTVIYEQDKDFTEAAFSISGLRVYYFDSEGQTKEELKLSPNVRSMVVQDFPRHMRTFEDRRWLIERIAEKNKLELESIEPHIEEMDYAFKSIGQARRQNIQKLIDYELYKVAHHNGVFRVLDLPWDVQTNGQRGARYYIDTVLERPDVPWIAIRQGPPFKRDDRGFTNRIDEKYLVHFRTPAEGLRIVDDIVDMSMTEPVFRCDASDSIGPSFTPIYRLMTPITRQMRLAFNSAIQAFDFKMRNTFPNLSANEDPLMEDHESSYYSVRVYENWKNDHSEAGLIGVEGWNSRGIRHFFGRLKKLLRPVEFQPNEHGVDLLSGVGEVWVRSLEVKYEHQVLMDIDKFRGVISIFGSRAQQALEDLQNYQDPEKNIKQCIQVTTQFSLSFPMFNDVGVKLLTARSIQKMSSDLGALCQLDQDSRNIRFDGTLEAYEELTRGMAQISSEVYKKFTADNKALKTAPIPMTCPACFCETEHSDFFRFHCGHEMCRPCVNNMVSSKMDEMQFNIKCAHPTCPVFLTPDELVEIVIGGWDRIRELDAFKMSRMVARAKQALVNNSPDIEPCPTADCVGILTKDHEGPSDASKKCSTCHRDYCRLCLKEPHPDETCERFAELRKPDVSIAAYVDSVGRRNIKKCPNCSTWVLKNEGCDHIECKCGTHWCWVCLYVARDSKDCYAHMSDKHKTFGGEFRIVDGQLRANPGNEDLQEELDMQHVMLGDRAPIGRARLRPAPEPPAIRDNAFPRYPPGLEPPMHIPPPPLVDLPEHLIEEFPDFFGNNPRIQRVALEYVNEAVDQNERDERVEHLRMWPEQAEE